MGFGAEQGTKIFIYVILGLKTSVRLWLDQGQHNANFKQLSVTAASYYRGTSMYLDHEMQIDFAVDSCLDGYNAVRCLYKVYIGTEERP